MITEEGAMEVRYLPESTYRECADEDGCISKYRVPIHEPSFKAGHEQGVEDAFISAESAFAGGKKAGIQTKEVKDTTELGSIREVYDNAIASAKETYLKATTPAWEALLQVNKDYDGVTYSALAAYANAKQTAQGAYDKALKEREARKI